MAQLLVSIFAPIISAVVTIMVVVPASYLQLFIRKAIGGLG